jgi:hypothetical protein
VGAAPKAQREGAEGARKEQARTGPAAATREETRQKCFFDLCLDCGLGAGARPGTGGRGLCSRKPQPVWLNTSVERNHSTAKHKIGSIPQDRAYFC